MGGGRGYERILQIADFVTGLIHRICDLVWCMARQIFLQRVTKQAAPGALSSPSETLGTLEKVVGNRHGRFHTASITRITRSNKTSKVNGPCRARNNTEGNSSVKHSQKSKAFGWRGGIG